MKDEAKDNAGAGGRGPSALLPPRWSFSRLVRLARKELSESLRDRRTIVTLVLMPILLYPLLAVVFRTLLLSNQIDRNQLSFKVGYTDEVGRKELIGYLAEGERQALRRNHPIGPIEPEKDPSSVPPQYRPLPGWSVKRFENPENLRAAVREGLLDVGLLFSPPENSQHDGARGRKIDCELIYLEDSPQGRTAVLYIERLAAEANVADLASRLERLHGPEDEAPVRLRAEMLPTAGLKRSPLLPVLVPLILILMTITGAVYPAIDLTAGERERGTLEILVAAPIPRMSVLFAKYVAVFAVALLTALVNLGAMASTLMASGLGAAVFGATLTVGVLLQVLALLLLFAAFFSAVLLAVTSFARSFKEAQAYLIPLMLLALTPGTLGLIPGLSLDGPLAVVPLINIVLLSRDLFEGTAQVGTTVVVVVTTLLYALAAVAVAARIFGTEAVLSSEQSGWGDLFERPRESRPAPALSSGLLCLALLFPTYFMVTGLLGQAGDLLSAWDRLVVTNLANLGLFVGMPALFVWRGHVETVSGLRLRRPPWWAWGTAVLLGLSLWPFAHEVILFLRQAGFATLSKAQLEKLPEQLTLLRSFPAWMLVLSLAAVPALVEELFFRGFLFRAIESETRSPWVVVTATAGLFALFHLLVTDSLAVERLPPSLMMGLVLGWLAWKSGSIWPGVLLHTLYNGSLVLLAYYEPLLAERGWVLPEADAHLSAGLLMGTGVVAAIGLGWVALARRAERGKMG